MQNMALFFLVAVAIGGVAWVFLYPILSGEQKAEKRKETVVRTASTVPARAARNAQKSRREQVEGSLKELENRRAKSVPLTIKITQAGLDWSKQRFFITGGVLAVAAFLFGIHGRCRPADSARHGIHRGHRRAALAAQIPQEAT